MTEPKTYGDITDRSALYAAAEMLKHAEPLVLVPVKRRWWQFWKPRTALVLKSVARAKEARPGTIKFRRPPPFPEVKE